MGPELSLLIGSIVGGTGALLSFWAGWRARGDVIRVRGDVIGRPPLIFNEGRTIRGNGNGGPITPKPEIVPKPVPASGRNPFVSDFQQQINNALNLDGYRSINYPDPSPDRRPTNPFNGERITLTESPIQRGNRSGAPTTPKPEIVPKPQFPPPRRIREDFLP